MVLEAKDVEIKQRQRWTNPEINSQGKSGLNHVNNLTQDLLTQIDSMKRTQCGWKPATHRRNLERFRHCNHIYTLLTFAQTIVSMFHEFVISKF